MYMIDFTVLLAPGVVEDRLKPPHIQYPAWIALSDGKRTRVRMVAESQRWPRELFRDATDFNGYDMGDDGFFCTPEFPLPSWFDTTGWAVNPYQDDFWYTKAKLPEGAPTFDNVKGGKIKATITMAKPESKIYQKPQVVEEIIGEDQYRMEMHVAAFLRWLRNYDAYYSCKGWTYEVKWKGLPTPA